MSAFSGGKSYLIKVKKIKNFLIKLIQQLNCLIGWEAKKSILWQQGHSMYEQSERSTSSEKSTKGKIS